MNSCLSFYSQCMQYLEKVYKEEMEKVEQRKS